MEIAVLLLVCAVFAGLAAFALTTAFKAARVDDLIGEALSPWLQDPFGDSNAASVNSASAADDPGSRGSGPSPAETSREPVRLHAHPLKMHG